MNQHDDLSGLETKIAHSGLADTVSRAAFDEMRRRIKEANASPRSLDECL